MHIMFCSWNGLVLDHPMPIGTWSVASIIAHFCRIRWGRLFAVNNQNFLSMMSFCSRTLQYLIANTVWKIWCNTGAGRCWNILPAVQILSHAIIGSLHMWKNILGVNCYNWKMKLTLLSLPLYIIWARTDFRAAIDRLPHSWEKCVDSAGDYFERRTYVYIQKYQLCCYHVFCYYNKSIHKTSEMTYAFKNCYFYILILCENGAWLLKHRFMYCCIFNIM